MLKKRNMVWETLSIQGYLQCGVTTRSMRFRVSRAQCFWGSFEGVRDFKFPWCGGLLHVSRRLFWRYWPSITSNFDTVIKRNCLIHFLQNLMALDGSLNVIQNGQTKFCCLVYGKYTPLIENSYLVISGLLLFYKFNFSAFGLQVSRRSCG